MKIGSLVRVRAHEKYLSGKMGIILDTVELRNGFSMYEILIEGEAEWFDDIDLEAILDQAQSF